MSDPEIERIKNLPIEERGEALLAWIKKLKTESPDTIECFPDFPFGPIPHWIDCEIQMPTRWDNVIVASEGMIAFAQWTGDLWRFLGDSDLYSECYCPKGNNSTSIMHRNKITHWMPLPEMPGE